MNLEIYQLKVLISHSYVKFPEAAPTPPGVFQAAAGPCPLAPRAPRAAAPEVVPATTPAARPCHSFDDRGGPSAVDGDMYEIGLYMYVYKINK